MIKNSTLFILILSFISCSSYKKANYQWIGTYEYKTANKSENHYIVIDTINGKYDGIYFGSEDSGGHGVFFYKNEIENLTVDGKNISFNISKRDLYETTQIKIVKHKRDLEKDSIRGISMNSLKYSGEISENGFKLNCTSEFGYCWDDQLNFEKLIEQK